MICVNQFGRCVVVEDPALQSGEEQLAFKALRQAMHRYAELSETTWSNFASFCHYRTVAKHGILYALGEVPRSFAYVYTGLFRVYVLGDDGREYNKNFFFEDRFPGSMAAALTETPSKAGIEALEQSRIIEIEFQPFRDLLFRSEDLKNFHIRYLEQNWLIAKDAREITLVQDNATERYRRFLDAYPQAAGRIPQYHIASHLGVTPTQLSRIRKKQKK